MNYEEIAAMLAAGKSEEDIVKEFTDNLNKANAELRAQEEAKAETEKNEKRKNDLAEAIAACLNEYVAICGEENPGISIDDVRETLDSLMELIPLFKNLSIHIATPKTSKKVGIAGKGKPAIPDDIFAEFFKSLGI